MLAQLSFNTPAIAQTAAANAADARSFGASITTTDNRIEAQNNGSRTFNYKDQNGVSQSMSFTDGDMWGGQTVGDSSAWDSKSNMYQDGNAITAESFSTESGMSSTGDNWGEAYNSYKDGKDRSKPDIASDPIIANSNRIFSDVESGSANCGSGSITNGPEELCHRNNIGGQCSVTRQTQVIPISIVQPLFEFRGCVDHNKYNFKVMFPGAVDKEFIGYFIDTQTGIRYEQDEIGNFNTIPDSLLRSGPTKRTYPNLQYSANGSYQGRYGYNRYDIANDYPELNFTVNNLYRDSTDNTAYSYVKFMPIDQDVITSQLNSSSSIIQNISVSIAEKSHEYGVSGAQIYISDQPTEANGWIVSLRVEDFGESNTTPTCPIYSPNGTPDSFPGDGTMGFYNVKLNINYVGYIFKETIDETPAGCTASATQSCPLNFTCTDDSEKSYSPLTEQEARDLMTPMYNGDDPSDNNKNVCHSATAINTCNSQPYGYDPSLSCEAMEARTDCGFKYSECATYTPEGKCAFFIDKYQCGINNNYDSSCAIRQQLTTEFGACQKTSTPVTTTSNTYLDDTKSCEVIHDLTTCNRKRVTLNSTDSYFVDDPAEPGNQPCYSEPNDWVTEANWTCVNTVPNNPNAVPPIGPYQPMYPGDDGTCFEANVAYKTEWYYQSMDCYVDYNGDTICPVGDSSNVNKDTCAVHRNNGCTVKSSKCVDDGSSPGGFCFVEEFEYDCGTDVEVTDTAFTTEWDCPGDIQCMGNSCWEGEDESSTSFGQALAYTNAIQFAGQDSVCDPVSGDCTLFPGTPLECKKALGGYQDCCDSPATANIAEFLTMLYTVGKRSGMTTKMEEYALSNSRDILAGAYETLGSPGEATFTAVKDKFFSSASDAAGTGIGQAFTNRTAEFIGEVFGDAVRDVFFEATSGTAGEAGANYAQTQWVQTASTYMGYIMLAYAIYSAIVLAIQIVYKCEEDEFELANKRELRACIKVGSYCKSKTVAGCIEKREGFCCYSSPLSRIINEQGLPQIGRGFGSPKNPQCGGMSLNEFASLDWSQIDLSEWIAILTDAELMPNGDAQEMALQYSMQNLSGTGSTMAADADRDTVLEKSVEQQPSDPDKVYKDVKRSVDGQE
jgi:hypothetical protein